MILPAYLKPNNRVIIVAPAGKLKDNGLDTALATLNNWGLQVDVAEHVWDGHYYFSASDENRLGDLQMALDSEVYKAIFCARGGYGLTRIIDQLDFVGLKKFPKWVVGFSDVTALHLALSKHNIASIHSVMPTGFVGADPATIDSVKNLLFGKESSVQTATHRQNRLGEVTALVIGGNLSLLATTIGTNNEIDTDGKILFIEEIDEYLYKIDRMLGQLARSGKLTKLKGLVVGHMTGMKDTVMPFGCSIEELIYDHVKDYDFPVAFGLPIGHEPLNMAIVQEGEYRLSVSEGRSVLELIK